MADIPYFLSFTICKLVLQHFALAVTFPALQTWRASVFCAPSGLGQNGIEAASQSELLIGVALMSALQLPRLGSALVPPSHTANCRKQPPRAIFLCCMCVLNEPISIPCSTC